MALPVEGVFALTGPVQFLVIPNWQEKALPGVISLLQAVGNDMVAEMEQIVPEGDRDHEGPRLKDTLYAIVVQGRNARGHFGQQELRVGADADYAMDVEFGHFTVGGKTFVEAQPFLRPVLYKFRDAGNFTGLTTPGFANNPNPAIS